MRGIAVSLVSVAIVGALLAGAYRANYVSNFNRDAFSSLSTGVFSVETTQYDLPSGQVIVRLGGVKQIQQRDDGIRRFLGGEQPIEIAFSPNARLGGNVSFIQLVRGKYNTYSDARMRIERTHPQSGPDGWHVDSNNHPHAFYRGDRSDSRMGSNPFRHHIKDAPSILIDGPGSRESQNDFMTLAFTSRGDELHFLGGIKWTVKFTSVSYPQKPLVGKAWSQNANATEVMDIDPIETLPQETLGAVERFYASRGYDAPFVFPSR
ncbi:hypothetical protein [Novipirellula rosea]